MFTVCAISELNVKIIATAKKEIIDLSANKVLNVSIRESDSSFSLTSGFIRSVVNSKHNIYHINAPIENTNATVVNLCGSII